MNVGDTVINMDKFSTAIVLAGGQSTRMGFDKQLLRIHERRLMDSIVTNLKGEFKDIIIVTNRPELYGDFEETIIEDILKFKGPLGGMHAGLSIAKSKYAFVVACDMPRINLSYVKHMKAKLDEDNSLGCVTQYGDWIEPFSAFYSVDLVEKIEKYLRTSRRSINGLIKDLNMTYIPEDYARKFSPNWDMFLNLNTRNDVYDYLNTSTGWGS